MKLNKEKSKDKNSPLPQKYPSNTDSVLKEINDKLNKIEFHLNGLETYQETPNFKTKSEIKNLMKLEKYRTKIAEAVSDKKIFTISSRIRTIRKVLKRRGWIEKCSSNVLKSLQNMSFDQNLREAENGNDHGVVVMSKLLKSFSPNFIWKQKYPRLNFENEKLVSYPYLNRIYRRAEVDFTTKIGLMGCIDNSYYIDQQLFDVRVPRQFKIISEADRLNFLHEFRITSCLSLLLFATEQPQSKISNEFGIIPTDLLKFAIKNVDEEVDRRLKNKTHKIEETEQIREMWKRFHLDCHLIQNSIMKFNISNNFNFTELVKSCEKCLTYAKKVYPTIEHDGYENIWIFKPTSSCRGIGIFMQNSYEQIIIRLDKQKNRKYIVQKYLERPLLIYNTKFDIRQYFLMTINESSVSIWMYKECYLKFSSQNFNLQNFKESIHVTNNAVQKKYKNTLFRDEKLPIHNMWELNEFRSYLKTNNLNDDDIWNKIYFAMKKNIITVVLSTLDKTDLFPKSFEIYGADFILDTNFEPFLLEINANPDMTSSTKVTANLCPKVLEDLIKVVIDFSNDEKSDTGNFENILEIKISVINELKKTQIKGFIEKNKAKNIMKSKENLNKNKENRTSNQLVNLKSEIKKSKLRKLSKSETTKEGINERAINIKEINQISIPGKNISLMKFLKDNDILKFQKVTSKAKTIRSISSKPPNQKPIQTTPILSSNDKMFLALNIQ